MWRFALCLNTVRESGGNSRALQRPQEGVKLAAGGALPQPHKTTAVSFSCSDTRAQQGTSGSSHRVTQQMNLIQALEKFVC